METYIALLLFIVPGFLARDIYQKLNNEPGIENQFNSTISALIYSIFILLINYQCYNIYLYFINCFKWQTITLSDIKINFLSITFISRYAVLTIIVSCLFAYFWSKVHPKYTMKLVNKIREIGEKPKTHLVKSAWVCRFENIDSQYVLIEKDGKEIGKGLISNYGQTQEMELRDIYLEGQEKLLALENINGVPKIKGIYYSCTNNLKITEYDLDELISRK